MGLFRQLFGKSKSDRCERCRVKRRVPTERYCYRCRALMLHRMKVEGYLTLLPGEERMR